MSYKSLVLYDVVFLIEKMSLKLKNTLDEKNVFLSVCFIFFDKDFGEVAVTETVFVQKGESKVKISYPFNDKPITGVSFKAYGYDDFSSQEGMPVFVDDDEVSNVINNMFPITDSDYESIFSRRKDRSGNILNQFFFAKQVERFFKGSPHYVVGAIIVKIYKAVESGDDYYLKDSLLSVEKALSLVDKCEVSWNPRVNKEHLQVSVLCAAMHLYVALLDKKNFLLVLDKARDAFSSNCIGSYMTAAFPVSKIFLAGFFFSFLKNDVDGSAKFFNLLHENFLKAAVTASTDKKSVILYNDLQRILQASCYANELYHQKLGKVEDANSGINERLQFVFRTGGKSRNVMVDNFYELTKG